MIVGFGDRGLNNGSPQSNAVRKSSWHDAPPDPPAKSTHKTTHKELGGVKGLSRQVDKSMHKRSDQVIVEFPKERRMSSTVRVKEQGVSKSLTDVTTCPEKQSERLQSMPRRLSKSLTDATSFPEKGPGRRQSMPDWMKISTIDWGVEDDD